VGRDRCLVLTAQQPRLPEVRLWLDVERGYLLRRARSQDARGIWQDMNATEPREARASAS
jgi:hypothetical protein